MQGYRLFGDHYEPIAPDENGRLLCRELDLSLSLENGDLVMHDVASGARLLSEAEAERAAAEAEIQRLRKKLDEHGLS